MIRTRSLVSGFLSLTAAAALTISAGGVAGASPAATDDKKTPSVTSRAVDSPGAADYWTADRMRAAVSGEVLAGKAVERGTRSSAVTVEKGQKTEVKPTSGKPTLAKDEAPVKSVGKIFFTLAGANYVCSGNSVAAPNKSTVATAGHCVSGGPGTFATNFVFVPAYENGAAPYGKWTATSLHTPTEWSAGGDISYDTGFAVMGKNSAGQNLADVVGATGVAFNQDRALTYQSFGYPASSPFNGETLKSCSGSASDDTINAQFGTQGIPCDMNGGASGGPWFVQGAFSRSGAPVQNSINSYGYDRSGIMYGPYWGSVIQQTYNEAARS
jgi:V8-like Glu-specific endopeptidase